MHNSSVHLFPPNFLIFYYFDQTDLESLEKSGNFTNLEKSSKSQGISPKVRELFEAGLLSKANHPRLLKWTYAG